PRRHGSKHHRNQGLAVRQSSDLRFIPLGHDARSFASRVLATAPLCLCGSEPVPGEHGLNEGKPQSRIEFRNVEVSEGHPGAHSSDPALPPFPKGFLLHPCPKSGSPERFPYRSQTQVDRLRSRWSQVKEAEHLTRPSFLTGENEIATL